MKSIFLILFLLSIQAHAMHNPDENDRLTRKMGAGMQFLVSVKDIAYDIGCYSPLLACEKKLSHILPESYRHSNTLATVVFNSCVLAPELRKNSAIIAARLTTNDLNVLHDHLSRIQDRIEKIADNQGLEIITPLLLTIDNTSLFTAFRTAATKVAATFGARDTEHDFKQEMLVVMLSHFEKVGALAPIIKVKDFTNNDYYRMEEISSSLDALKSIFKKAKAL
jgi:hypothetical protein